MRADNVDVNDLVDVLTKMYSSTIVLDEEGLKKLGKVKFNNPVDFANLCFKAGWNESVKVMLQSLRRNDEHNN